MVGVLERAGLRECALNVLSVLVFTRALPAATMLEWHVAAEAGERAWATPLIRWLARDEEADEE
eukprot:6252368-Prymnesium_polylepis.1